MSQLRQPEGIPAGGQFAAAAHSEPGLSLAVLPDSCIGYGDVISETVDEDGAERVVTAMTSTPEFDEQLRSHLGITELAPVQVSYEVVYYDGDEGQVYVASCAGKQATSHSRSTLLKQITSPKETAR
ncbi:hypothetical protein [Pseudarthrobacter sp. BIM B-2242]|uniref:hypothetical protein n=1 Tax=Pseudarthrobacter sp. BIM B-2242 TaxID=2772401 RepID=UPI00168AF918|nr:hypothetical protein [Pseudarthrobacter sp. BIM B-2242]QOD06104.1 hypothetical protein IDT60_21325 [Pseudarthrobacter sp. BIM B-2242]